MRPRDQRRSLAPKPLPRRLHFGDEVWTYRIGSGHAFVRTPDAGVTFRVPLTEVTGMTWDDLERGAWKGWWKGVGPQQLKDYVELHLRPDPEISLPPVVFVHPWAWASSTWHLRKDCYFLPQLARGQKFNAVGLDPEVAAARLGGALTRRNLCGICMRRRFVSNSEQGA